MELTAANVDLVGEYCLFTDDEVAQLEATKTAVIVEGVVLKIGFHPGRLETRREDIGKLIDGLDEHFFADSEAGGHSFLRLPFKTQDALGVPREVHWCEHRTADMLLCLALAVGRAKFLLEDRALWRVMPGGMPYIVFAR